MPVARALLWLSLSGLLAPPPLMAAETVTIGSKKFTESVILGELAAQLAGRAGVQASHRRELGGTRVLWNALRHGDIDLYPEYTGTLTQEIFGQREIQDLGDLRAALAAQGLGMTAPLGFNNTYALGMRRVRAEELGIRTLSDLRAHPQLRLGFSNEFLNRADGWPGLRARYGLPQQAVRGLDHDLAYRGLASGDLDLIDLYTTDAEIAYYGLTILDDDQHFFPDYRALYLYHAGLETRAPEVLAMLHRLEGRIAQADMVALNSRVKLAGVPESQAAADFVHERLGLAVSPATPGTVAALARHTREHLLLVCVSLGAALLVAIPLGILSARRPRTGRLILALTGVIQTIPSLALLVLMIPLLGIGPAPAIVALFLYSLLPIVRNTCTGLTGIRPEILDSARALGLPPLARLRLVELPLAMPTILAGVKTSAVINVGTATLGALIGAGGYGQPILTGIRLDDLGLILQGAVPAAVLALLVQGGFGLAERYLIPQGLRLQED